MRAAGGGWNDRVTGVGIGGRLERGVEAGPERLIRIAAIIAALIEHQALHLIEYITGLEAHLKDTRS